MAWDDANPVFIDFETQSACDITEASSRAYVEHPSTRILILAMCINGVYHVWIPDYINTHVPDRMLWPYQLQPRCEVKLYRDSLEAFRERLPMLLSGTRTLVAHNAFNFDARIWARFLPDSWEWCDTLPLAKAAGKAGKLDKLGKALLGVGKDHAKKLLPKLTTARQSIFDTEGFAYPHILPGDLEAFTRYAVADVEILRRLWDTFDSIKVEADVIEVHNRINNRGIAVDVPLLTAIERVSEYSVSQAAKEIEKLTGGFLNASNLRSAPRVHEWLERYGVYVVDENGKKCLRKEIVKRFIDSPYFLDESLQSAVEIPPIVPAVLRLRMHALRITDAKVSRAKNRVSADGRIYDLFAYHNAHTGRFSSFGFNIHNLPRPHSDLYNVLEVLANNLPTISNDARELFDSIKGRLPANGTATVDDVCSALLRPALHAGTGKRFAIADFAQVEARGVAWLCGENKMLDAFRKGRDLYREFAAIMFSCTLEEVTKDQRHVAKSAVLGCGYSLGADKFRVYAANNGANLVAAGITAEEVIAKFRDTYTRIAGWKPNAAESFRVGGVWKELEKAAKDCVVERVPTSACRIRFHIDTNADLVCTLPSDREIRYTNARIEDIVPPYCYTLGLPLIPKATIVYDSEFCSKSLYGGLITENVTQAMCRDLMVSAMLELEAQGMRVVAHVHDEIIVECDEGTERDTLRDMVRIMSTAPAWAEDFPLACEGFTSRRFTKIPERDAFHFASKDLIQSK